MTLFRLPHPLAQQDGQGELRFGKISILRPAPLALRTGRVCKQPAEPVFGSGRRKAFRQAAGAAPRCRRRLVFTEHRSAGKDWKSVWVGGNSLPFQYLASGIGAGRNLVQAAIRSISAVRVLGDAEGSRPDRWLCPSPNPQTFRIQ
jgi:hypothetical protein